MEKEKIEFFFLFIFPFFSSDRQRGILGKPIRYIHSGYIAIDSEGLWNMNLLTDPVACLCFGILGILVHIFST